MRVAKPYCVPQRSHQAGLIREEAPEQALCTCQRESATNMAVRRATDSHILEQRLARCRRTACAAAPILSCARCVKRGIAFERLTGALAVVDAQKRGRAGVIGSWGGFPCRRLRRPRQRRNRRPQVVRRAGAAAERRQVQQAPESHKQGLLV